MPRYILTIRELPDFQGLPGIVPSGIRLIPETRHQNDVVNMAFQHAGLIRDDYAGACPAAIVTAITGNGGTAA